MGINNSANQTAHDPTYHNEISALQFAFAVSPLPKHHAALCPLRHYPQLNKTEDCEESL